MQCDRLESHVIIRLRGETLTRSREKRRRSIGQTDFRHLTSAPWLLTSSQGLLSLSPMSEPNMEASSPTTGLFTI